MSEKVERRLAAIVSIDIVGYTQLMQADEEGTLSRLRAILKDVTEPKIAANDGRIVKLMGDGVLVEFASVIDAVRCAVDVQREMAEQNADVPQEQRIQYRIGINVGDIIVEGDDIFGDGVNIASRMEQLSEAGGICISGDAFRQVEGKVDIGFATLGEQQVKGVENPIPSYRILLDPADAGSLVESTELKAASKRHKRLQIAAALVIFAIGLAGGLLWTQPWVPRVEAADEAKMAYELPEQPSIAIMPFENLSGDPEQDFLADGIVDAIITALTSTEQLFVIARNSTFTYKDKPFRVKDVAEEFGVRHVLEGSFHRSEDTVRITARLSDAISGRQIWADTFDRKMGDIFALQDDITAKIVEELQIKLTVGEQGRIWRQGTSNAEAYQLVLKSLEYYRRVTPEDNARSRDFAEQALALDPDYVQAQIAIFRSYNMDWYNKWAKDPALAFTQAIKSIEKALAMDDTNGSVHAARAWMQLYSGDREGALASLEKSVALQPGGFDIASGHYHVLIMDGRQPQEAINWFNRGKRQRPNIPKWHEWILVEAFRQQGQYADMIELANSILAKIPTWPWEHPRLVYAHMKLGQEEEAQKLMKEWLEIFPNGASAYLAAIKTFPKPLYDDTVATLVAAGLPDPSKSADLQTE